MPDSWDYSQRPKRAESAGAEMPILTYLLIALSVIVTVASLTAGKDTTSLLYRIGHIGYVGPEAIWSGHYWGLVTPIFIHGSWIHLLFDMIWLYQLGRIMEASISQLKYLAILVAAAVVGSASEMLISGSPGIGMSGVVYALFGVMWMGRGAQPTWRTIATPQNLRLMVGWALFCVVATQLNILHIANGAHVGGFILGLSIGGLFFMPRRRWLWAAPLALLIALSVLAVTWVPWSPNWDFWKAGREFNRVHYAQAVRWYEQSVKHGASPSAAWGNISIAWHNIALQEKAKGDTAATADALAKANAAQTQSEQAPPASQ